MDCFAVLAMTLCLTSCLTPTGKQKPVDVVAYGAKSGAGSTGMHTVLGGDTVYTVAKEYNLPLREIISLNNLSPPYHLNSGFRLRLPPPNEYKVGTGDTLNGLSRMFNVSVSEMARLNNLPAPYTLRAGQIVRLPSPQPKLEEEFSTNPAPPSFEQVSVPMAVGSVEREVLAPPPGQAPSKDNKAVSAVLAPPASSSSSAPSTPSTTAAATSAFPPQPAAKTVGVQKVAAVTPSVVSKPPPRVGNGKFMRPVDGKVLSGYGPKPDGLHNDGINIKAPRGSAVRAADNGVVAYVGSDMQGYGNLILIRHADRWMTAYAHMEKMLVKKGDVVKAGQSIGTVGSTGGVDSPQLHFEVRKGTQAMNPETYL